MTMTKITILFDFIKAVLWKLFIYVSKAEEIRILYKDNYAAISSKIRQCNITERSSEVNEIEKFRSDIKFKKDTGLVKEKFVYFVATICLEKQFGNVLITNWLKL